MFEINDVLFIDNISVFCDQDLQECLFCDDDGRTLFYAGFSLTEEALDFLLIEPY